MLSLSSFRSNGADAPSQDYYKLEAGNTRTPQGHCVDKLEAGDVPNSQGNSVDGAQVL